MAHVGTLGNYRFSGDIDDIRGSSMYNRSDDQLGDIDDIIFNHASGDIEYLVIDTGGWLSSHKFLVPADRVQASDDSDRYYVDLIREQIERFPEYHERIHEEQGQWRDYERRYHQCWTTSGGILKEEGSQNIPTPDSEEMPPVKGDVHGDVAARRRDPNATADLTEPYPAHGRRWRAFEDNLRRNRVDVTASCRSCSPAKDRAA